MKTFPDETRMEKGKTDAEPIRGGSIGLNRILGNFVKASTSNRKPKDTVYLLSAYTIFRNVHSTLKQATMGELESAFIVDVNLFVDYYDTYLSWVLPHENRGKKALVLVYFPDYHHVPDKILRVKTGKGLEFENLYKAFYKKHKDVLEGEVRQTDHVRCIFVKAGGTSYPHKDLARQLKDTANLKNCLYVQGDPVVLLSHIPLDLYLGQRVRQVELLESYTGILRPMRDFGVKLDKSGVLPFNPTTHLTFGDDPMIKPMVQGKKRSELLEQAKNDHWINRSEGEIRSRIIKALGVSSADFMGFDFG